MRRIVYTVIISVILCRLLTVFAVGGTSVELVPTQTYVDVGQNIVFNAVLSNNSEICGMSFEIAYDSTKFEFVSDEIKTAPNGSYVSLASEGHILYYAFSSSPITNGTLFNITLKAKSSSVLVDKTSLNVLDLVAGDFDGLTVLCTGVGTKVAIRNPNNIAFAGETFVYDETQKGITVTGGNYVNDSNDPIAVTVLYTNNVATNAGAYDAVARVSFNCGFATIPDIVLNATLVINKAEQPVPNNTDAVINFINESISFGLGLEANSSPNFTEKVIVSESVMQPGTTIYLRFKEDANHYPSLTLAFVIPARPAAPGSPVAKNRTATSVTLDAVSGTEYKCNDGMWQDSSVFTGLMPETIYTFYSRTKATEDAFKSSSSVGSTIVTFPKTIIISNININVLTNTITATFENHLEYDIALATIVASVYSEGKLVATKNMPITGLANNYSITKQLTFSSSVDLSNFKIFVWDSYITLKPLSKIYTNLDSTFYVLKISNVSVNEQDKTITATFENNLGYDLENATVFVSVYHGSKLIATRKLDISGLKNNTSVTNEFSFLDVIGLSDFKIFVWNNSGSIMPLAKRY